MTRRWVTLFAVAVLVVAVLGTAVAQSTVPIHAQEGSGYFLMFREWKMYSMSQSRQETNVVDQECTI